MKRNLNAAREIGRNLRRAEAWIACLTGLILFSCSTTAMESSPLWDSPSGGAQVLAEDRVNVWPLFYYNDPTLSIFWPLFSSTANGHALVPVYEYDKSTDELRLGTVHQILPALSVFAGEEEYGRILNFVRDRKEDRFFIIPIYFQDFDDPSLLIIPLLYKDEDTIWTPLFMKSDDMTGVLWPLFFVYDHGDFKSYNFPFPLVRFSTGEDKKEFRAFPLVYYDNENARTVLNLAGVLLRMTRTEDELELHYLFPLGSVGENDEGSWNYLFPLYYTSEDSAGIRSFYSALVSYRSDGSLINFGGPLYIATEDEGGWRRSILWPIWTEVREGEKHMTRLLPLFERMTGPEERHFISLPISFGEDEDSSFINFGGILYHRDENEEHTTAFFPFPIVGYSNTSDGERTASWFFPLFGRWKNPEERHFISLPFSFGEDTNSSYVNIAGVLYHQDKNERRTRRYFPWPIIGFESGKAEESFSSWVFPLYGYNRSEESVRFTSIPFSRRERFTDLETDEREILDYFERAEQNWVPRRRIERSGYDALLGILASSSSTLSGASKPFEEGPELADNQRLIEGPEGEKGIVTISEERERSFLHLFGPFGVYRRTETVGEGSEMSFLWRLFDSSTEVNDDGTERKRRRVLWRVFHGESEGDKTSIDLFPFISYDRAEDLSKFSFMGGLLGYGSKDGVKTLRLFYLPINL